MQICAKCPFALKSNILYISNIFIYVKLGVVSMKEYEIVAKFCNACAGSSRPQTFFEEAELENTDDFVRM